MTAVLRSTTIRLALVGAALLALGLGITGLLGDADEAPRPAIGPAPNGQASEQTPPSQAPSALTAASADGAAAPTESTPELELGYELRGVVLDAERSVPLEGQPIDLFAEGLGRIEPSHSILSGASGAFLLRSPGPESAQAYLVLRPAAGFVQRGGPRLLSAAELSGEKEVRLYLARGASEPLSGQVVDASSGDPIPHLSVAISSGHSGSEVATTDALGAWTSEGGFPAGDYQLSFQDPGPEGPVLIDSVGVEHLVSGAPPAPWVHTIEIGPTYYFQVPAQVAATNPAGFRVELLPPARAPEASGWLFATQNRISLHPDFSSVAEEQAEPAPVASSRPGAPLWVRWPHPLRITEPDAPHLLYFTSLGWSGAVRVHYFEGVHPGVLSVPMEQVGLIHGLAQDASLQAPPGSVARLWPAHGEAAPVASDVLSGPGFYVLEDVPYGRYTLEISTDVHAPHRVEVLVKDPMLELDAHTFPTIASGGVIAGYLLAPDNAASQGVAIHLAHAGGAPVRRTILTAPSGNRSGEDFRFEDLPEGEYEVSLQPLAGQSYRPMRQRVFTPDQQVTFELDTSAEESVHEISAEGSGGAPLNNFGVYLGPGGHAFGQDEVRGASAAAWSFKRGVELEVCVWSSGYRPQWFDQTNFDDVQGGRSTSVQLETGWGATLRFRKGLPSGSSLTYDDSSRLRALAASQPLPDVLVTAMGDPTRVLGRSDAEGVVRIVGPAPENLAVYADGWLVDAVSTLRTGLGPEDACVWMVPQIEELPQGEPPGGR